MNYATWMEDNSAILGGKMLKECPIPGSHDSGTYDLTFRYSPDADPLFRWTVSPLAVFPWAVAQAQRLDEQLANGIRYLDLRVVYGDGPHGDDYYLAHGLYGPRFDEAWQQIVAFASAHPKEIVIVEIGCFAGFGEGEEALELHKVLAAKMVPTQRLIPATYGPAATFSALWGISGSPNIIVAYDKKEVFSPSPDWMWGPIVSSWGQKDHSTNSNSPADLLARIPDAVANRPDDLYILSGEVTPDAALIVGSFFFVPVKLPDGSTTTVHSLWDLAQVTSPWVIRYLRAHATAVDFITITDFVTHDFVDAVIEAATDQTWRSNGDWNANYFGPLDDWWYFDANLVECPPGMIVQGLALYRKGGPQGNRLAPTLWCTLEDGTSGTWVVNSDWNASYYGPLSSWYADTNAVVCPPDRIIRGVRLYQKGGNRIGLELYCTKADGSDGTHVTNSSWNSSYVGPLAGFYADTNHVVVDTGTSLGGAALMQKGGPNGNRIAPRILQV